MQRRTFLMAAAARVPAGSPRAEPHWPAVAPQAAGFDARLLDRALQHLAARRTRALLILQGGRLAVEWYAPEVTAATRHPTASLVKALVGGTSLLVATADDRIRASDRACQYIPQWADDPLKSKITIRHLATHTSGIEDATIDGIADQRTPGWKGQFWRADGDPVRLAIHDAPMLFEPGARNQYSNPGMAALAYAISASLRRAPQPDVRLLLRDRVYRPIGLPDDAWSLGWGRPWRMDGMEVWGNWGGGNFTARAMTRIGEWMLRQGEWRGQAIVPKSLVAEAVAYAGLPLPDRVEEPLAPGNGLAWYTNFDGIWPAVPRDAFSAAGSGHQLLLVVPSLDLVLLRSGGELASKAQSKWWNAVYEHLVEPIMRALRGPV